MDAEEQDFQRLYGPWEPWTVEEAAAQLDGIGAPWWICGGHALEAFTGRRRPHADLDIGMFRRDLSVLREHFAGRLHLWSAGGGMLRPLDASFPDLHPESAQVWLREHALAPWRADVVLTPTGSGEWVFKLDPTVRMPLAQATWLDERSRRILRPEIVLAHKVKQNRPKDDDDFAGTWPLLAGPARRWLREAVSRVDASHPWLNRMAAPDRPVRREGRRVRLREATLDDAGHFDAWARDRRTTMGEFNDFGLPPSKPLAESLDRGRRLVSREAGQLVVERVEDGAVLGDVTWHQQSYGPTAESKVPNIGISLVPEARGQGYGVEAQRLLAELLFELYDVVRVEASTDVDNIAEQRALEKAGFTREGVLRCAQHRAGGHHDMLVYSILRSELPSASGRV
jgi:RimJ/RimL family protein N-acetyltransferase